MTRTYEGRYNAAHTNKNAVYGLHCKFAIPSARATRTTVGSSPPLAARPPTAALQQRRPGRDDGTLSTAACDAANVKGALGCGITGVSICARAWPRLRPDLHLLDACRGLRAAKLLAEPAVGLLQWQIQGR